MKIVFLFVISLLSTSLFAQISDVQKVEIPTKEEASKLPGVEIHKATEIELDRVDFEIVYSEEGKFYHWSDQIQPESTMQVTCPEGTTAEFIIMTYLKNTSFDGKKVYGIGCYDMQGKRNLSGAFRDILEEK